MRILALVIPFFIYACNSTQVETPAVEQTKPKTIKDTIEQDNSKLNKAYVAAIGEYIKELYKDTKNKPDTLFIGRHPEFPDIILPGSIENLPVLIITTEEGDQRSKIKPITYLNVFGWNAEDDPEFMIVTFTNGFRPQHNCHLYFTKNNAEFKLDSLKMDYQYNKK